MVATEPNGQVAAIAFYHFMVRYPIRFSFFRSYLHKRLPFFTKVQRSL